jgi:hypothetical protein
MWEWQGTITFGNKGGRHDASRVGTTARVGLPACAKTQPAPGLRPVPRHEYSGTVGHEPAPPRRDSWLMPGQKCIKTGRVGVRGRVGTGRTGNGERLSVGSPVGTHGGCKIGGLPKKLCVM